MFEIWQHGKKLIFVKKGQKYGFIIGIGADAIALPFSRKSGFKLTEKSSSYIYQVLPWAMSPTIGWQKIKKTIFDLIEINSFDKPTQKKLILYVFEGKDEI